MPPRRILIVEDEVFVAMDLENILASAGFDVVGIAADRTEALNASGGAQMAFVDLNLRDGPTGTEVARYLASKDIKVFYVTANPSQIGEPAGTAMGYVYKPFDEAAIIAAASLLAGEQTVEHINEAVRLF